MPVEKRRSALDLLPQLPVLNGKVWGCALGGTTYFVDFRRIESAALHALRFIARGTVGRDSPFVLKPVTLQRYVTLPPVLLGCSTPGCRSPFGRELPLVRQSRLPEAVNARRPFARGLRQLTATPSLP